MAFGKFYTRSKLKSTNLGDHTIAQCDHKLHNKYIHYKPKNAYEGKETVKVYDESGSRNLIVPDRKPTDLPGIWSKSEYTRLKNQAHVVTKTEREAIILEAEKRKAELAEKSLQRKILLNKMQQHQTVIQGSTLADAESESSKKNQYILQRAFELRQEQEDEVKRANCIILGSKCLAIREAQIAERELIKREIEEEDRRLDLMMEQKRQEAIKLEEENQQKKEEKNKKFVKQVAQQIQENELLRLVEAQRKDEESRNLNKALVAMHQEDVQKLLNKKAAQVKMRDELDEANKSLLHYKRLQEEEQRIADLRVQEFMKKKAEREAARDAELAIEKLAKQHEIARLCMIQEKKQDQQAALDELNALRVQEEVEREWRDKELAHARNRKKQIEDLKKAREIQIEELRKWQAMEIERDEVEFHQVAKVQQEQYQKEMEKKRLRKEAMERHRKDLLIQINEKEKGRIESRQEKFGMGDAIRVENEIRELKVKEIVKKKLDKLRQQNLPEHYIKDVERQLKL